jgi:MFS family permease
MFHLSATQAALLVATPVLLGSVARLPMGMLADRFGGRLVFSLLMLAASVPAYLTPFAGTCGELLAGGFFLGLAAHPFRSDLDLCLLNSASVPCQRGQSPGRQLVPLSMLALAQVGRARTSERRLARQWAPKFDADPPDSWRGGQAPE